MKTKLFLFAAMLLVSVSAFAQSGNNEPLKGDVNGDGVVDVADIAAVIAIIKNNAAPQTTYYTYIGTDPTYKLVDENGDLKSDIATQIKSFSGVKTSTTKPTSVNDAYSADTTINGNGNYVYVIGLTSALNKTYYFKNAGNANVNMENLGTFTIGSDEYTVLSSVQVCATVTIL